MHTHTHTHNQAVVPQMPAEVYAKLSEHGRKISKGMLIKPSQKL